jgi:hypothetical protein
MIEQFPEAYFESEFYKDWVEEKLTLFPEYFWTVPASPSEKYHKKNGNTISLVDHTRQVLQVANELSKSFGLSESEKDICNAAIVIHDSFKCGKPKNLVYYKHNGNPKSTEFHPYIVRHMLKSNKRHALVDEHTIFLIVEGHMGIWSAVSQSYPFTDKEKDNNKSLSRIEQLIVFVHTCDMIASRECIEVKL